MMRILLAGLMLILLLPLQVFAEGKLPFSRSEEPIQIKSDKLQADNDRKMATFTGNVAARQGDLTIYADKLVVSYSDESGDISSAEVFGNVRIIQGERRAEADHAIYDAKNAKIVLDGNPKMFQNSDTLSGKVVTYYLDQDKSEVTSGVDSRVEAVIHPKGKGIDGKSPKP
jgi:lipopolysaccharide export system protein LptA